MAELKPCPFCGGEAKSRCIKTDWAEDKYLIYHDSENCILCMGGNPYLGRLYPSRWQAENAWNKRIDCKNYAHWIDEEGDGIDYICSNCGEYAGMNRLGEHLDRTAYCPNCGARMV